MKRVISIILAGLLVFSMCTAFSAQNITQAQVIENFKNGVYVGDWMPCVLSEETIRDMAECGIQYTVLWFFSYDDPEKVQQLEWFSKYGIKVLLLDDRLYGYKMLDMSEDEIYQIIKPSIGNPNILGYCIVDEPGVAQYDMVEECLKKFKAVAQGMIPFINIYGYTYGHYVDGVFSQLDQDFISMDAYPMIHENIVNEWYNGVRVVGEAARENDADMWIFLQSMGWPGADRDPQLDDMRWQLYAAIAFGATKFTHFCYSNPYYGPTHAEGNKDSIAAVNNGVKSPKWDILQQFDFEIQHLAPILSQYHSLGAYYTSARGDESQKNMPEYLESFAYNYQYRAFRTIEDISSDQYLIVGGFDHKTEPLKKAFVIHNTANSYYDIEADVVFSLRYSDNPVTVTMDGETFSVYPDDNGEYHIHLGSGGGAFIEVEERLRTQDEMLFDSYYADCCEYERQYYKASYDPSYYEPGTYKVFESAIDKYSDSLKDCSSLTLEALSSMRAELAFAFQNLATKEEVTNMYKEQALLFYNQIDPSLFDEDSYANVTSFMNLLKKEMEAPSTIDRLRLIVDRLLSSIDSMIFTGVSGDLNRDGNVSLADVMVAARCIMGLDYLDYTMMRIGDMNADKAVRLDDVLSIAKLVVKS